MIKSILFKRLLKLIKPVFQNIGLDSIKKVFSVNKVTEIDQVCTRPSGKGTEIVHQEFTYISDVPEFGKIVIPAGFETDAASIPRILWIIWPPFYPDYKTASIVHDFLHNNKEYSKSDKVFREILQKTVQNKGTILGLHLGVQVWHIIVYYIPSYLGSFFGRGQDTNLKDIIFEIDSRPIGHRIIQIIKNYFTEKLELFKEGRFGKYIRIILWLRTLRTVKMATKKLRLKNKIKK